MAPLSEFAPAKVNLHLHVVGRRNDGYHLLDSLVVFADVGDRLTVHADRDLSLSVLGPFASLLHGDNLVLRAARDLADRAGIRPSGRLILEKNLPVASGIGGGSADAAAALRLLSRSWALDQGLAAMVAAGVGADVPVCLASRASLMSGVGEILQPAPRLPDIGIVMINPGVAVSTPAVFGARVGPFSSPARFPEAGWTDVDALVDSLRSVANDLEAPAISLAPVIEEALEALAAARGCLFARMSGSGATCFGLFPTAPTARKAARTLVQDGWWVWGGGLAAT